MGNIVSSIINPASAAPEKVITVPVSSSVNANTNEEELARIRAAKAKGLDSTVKTSLLGVNEQSNNQALKRKSLLGE